jgi:hypothetical protein
MGDTPNFGSPELSNQDLLEDAKAFNKGKGKLLFGMVFFVLVAVLGFAFYLVQDQPNPYGELGKQVNGLRGQYFDAFWTCALPGKRLSELKSDADLRAELDARAESGARYGQHLTRDCQPNIRELVVRLKALLPPDAARESVQNMIGGLQKMDKGASSFADYLEGLENAYEPAAAQPAMNGLVRGWYEFRKEHADLNQLVRSQLKR